MQLITIKRNGSPKRFDLRLDIRFLDRPGLTQIDTDHLEKQMDQICGWKLSGIGLGEGGDDQEKMCRRNIRHFFTEYPTATQVEEIIDQNYVPNTEPVCMAYQKTSDLHADLGYIYQLMYFHYFLGRKIAMRGMFPNYCCGISSKNVAMALWDSGIFAAVAARNCNWDHDQVIIPYQVLETGQAGVIQADPTSDQLHNEPCKKVRNLITLQPPSDWEYKTDWKNGRNLYPEYVQLSTLRGKYEIAYGTYVAEAVQNPAALDI